MKKIICSIFAIATASILLVGCSKSPDKNLPRRFGHWYFNAKLTMLDSTWIDESAGTAVFKKNTVKFNHFSFVNTNSDEINWRYNKSTNNISLISGNDSLVFNVTNITRRNETWESKIDSTRILTLKLRR